MSCTACQKDKEPDPLSDFGILSDLSLQLVQVHTYSMSGLNLHLLQPNTQRTTPSGCVVFVHGGPHPRNAISELVAAGTSFGLALDSIPKQTDTNLARTNCVSPDFLESFIRWGCNCFGERGHAQISFALINVYDGWLCVNAY